MQAGTPAHNASMQDGEAVASALQQQPSGGAGGHTLHPVAPCCGLMVCMAGERHLSCIPALLATLSCVHPGTPLPSLPRKALLLQALQTWHCTQTFCCSLMMVCRAW